MRDLDRDLHLLGQSKGPFGLNQNVGRSWPLVQLHWSSDCPGNLQVEPELFFRMASLGTRHTPCFFQTSASKECLMHNCSHIGSQPQSLLQESQHGSPPVITALVSDNEEDIAMVGGTLDIMDESEPSCRLSLYCSKMRTACKGA